MARTLRRRPLLSRLFTTYLTLVVVVMFTGIGPSVPVSFAEESGKTDSGGVVTPGVPEESEESSPAVAPPSEEEELPEPESDPVGSSDSGVEGDQGIASAEETVIGSGGSDGAMSPQSFSSMSGPSGNQPGGVTVPAEPPSGIGVVPERMEGNVDCEDLCPRGKCLEFKIDANPQNKTYLVGTVGSITITNSDGYGFDWSASGIEVYFVIVKGGPDSNVYDYSGLGGVTDDADLVSPINLKKILEGERHGVSHVTFCYKVPKEKPAIVIEKRTNGQDANTPTGPIIPVGETVTWTYYVTNPGNVPLTNVKVTDNIPGVVPVYVSGDSDGDGKLDVGETWVYSASGAAVAGQYVNIGTATGTSPKGSSVSDTDLSHYFGARPALSLLKQASPATYDAVGDVITYTYTLTNSGNVTLSGPFTVEDDKATTSRVGAVPDPDVLAPGDDITFTATYLITQQDLDAGSVKNTAQGFGSFGEDKVESNIDDETVAALPDPELTLVKLATPVTYDAVGDEIGYTYRLTNSGNVTLMAPFSVDDDKATVTPVGVLPGVLAPNAFIDFEATYTITQADLDAGSVTNTARGHGKFREQVVHSNYDDETVTAVQRPALSLLKQASPATYDAVGDVVTYTYTLTNSGNVTLSGPFTVEDDKATTSRVGSVPDPDVLAPGDDITFTATYVITQQDLDAGSVKNIAQGFGSFGEDKIESNIDDETVTAVQNPAIAIVKLTNGADGEYIPVGAEITWSYQVTNTGNVTITDIVVTDDIEGLIGTIDSLAPGESDTLEHKGIAEEGMYENVGTAVGNPPDGEAVVDDDDDSSYFGSTPAIDVEKSVSSSLVLAGDEVTYTFVVTNTGNVPLSNVVVNDDKLGMIAEIDELAPGEPRTFTRTAVIMEPTTNIVVATGTPPVGEPVSDTDEAFVDIDEFLGFPDLGVKKSADRTKADPGDTITYTIVITNFGSAAVSNYVVEDTFDQRYLAAVDAAGGVVTNGKITWTFAEPLAAGATRTITYKMLVSENMPDGTTYLDNVVVVTHPDDENPDNDRSTWRVSVEEEPFLPFTGAELIGLLAMAGVAAATGTALRRRSRKAA